MPFKSRAHIAKIAELEKAGKVKKGTVKQWAAETPNIHKLPNRIGPASKQMSKMEQVRKYRKDKYGI